MNHSATPLEPKEYKAPQSLYIPPEALEVYLECFSGPLDLLLYLIRQKNLSISEVSIKKITDQYLNYIQNISHLKFELVAEYLLMAAILAEIKSKELLPKNNNEDEDEQAQMLVENLRQYEILTDAVDQLNQLERLDRDFFRCEVKNIVYPQKQKSFDKNLNLTVSNLYSSFEELMIKKERFKKYEVIFDSISTSEKMDEIMQKLKRQNGEFIRFEQLLNAKEGRLGLVVQLISLLELTKEGSIDMKQFSDGLIYARAK